MWKNVYETADLEQVMDDLYGQIKPLFLQLHSYVRRKLMKMYPDYVQKDSPIPAHLLGIDSPIFIVVYNVTQNEHF